MIVFQTGITVLYATIVLALAGVAAILYCVLIFVVMITWDGCELCKWFKQVLKSYASG